MKLLTIVGARPQFIKAAVVSRVIREHNYCKTNTKFTETVVHTGQHYDANMSEIFFDQMDLPKPDHTLGLGGGTHGKMTGEMLIELESLMFQQRPDRVLVYGDTNSTLAGALAASKLNIPIAHIEAGLRSFNRRMPEEVNRVLTDHISDMLFCPTDLAEKNLLSEGITTGIHNVGDIMFDASLFYRKRAKEKSTVLNNLGLTPGSFVLVTCHRQENTDIESKLRNIIEALEVISLDIPVVFPLHPRTKRCLSSFDLFKKLEKVIVVDPLSFFDMVVLEESAKVILTDSGGVQKEAYFFQKPCVTMRDETEWVETIDAGVNVLVGTDSGRIVDAVYSARWKEGVSTGMYGNGCAGQKILSALCEGNSSFG